MTQDSVLALLVTARVPPATGTQPLSKKTGKHERVGCRWVYCETFDTEVAAAAAYDRAIRHFRPQDAELYVNFKQSLPMAQPGPMPGAAYQTYWDTGDGTEDGQVCIASSLAPCIALYDCHLTAQLSSPLSLLVQLVYVQIVDRCSRIFSSTSKYLA